MPTRPPLPHPCSAPVARAIAAGFVVLRGDTSDGGLRGRYWWAHGVDVELVTSDDDFPTAGEAWGSAARAQAWERAS